MKRAIMQFVAASALSATVALSAWSANSVVVESKTVDRCTENVTVGVYIRNDAVLSGIAVPLEIRIVGDDHGFIKETLQMTTANRLAGKLTESVHTAYFSDESTELYPWRCDGIGFETRGSPDFKSPDAVLFVAAGVSNEYVSAGNDGSPPSGNPSLVLQFDVNEWGGSFEIDTTCVTPDNRLMFVDTDFNPVIPSFTKGTITIGGCDCPCHADPECDGVMDVVDVIQAVNVCFRNFPPVFDEECAYERTDLILDGTTGVLDVIRFVNVVFRNLPACVWIGDPCNP